MSDIREKLDSIANVKDPLKQVAIAKEAGHILKEASCPETIKYATNKLSEVYISVEQRHPLKKAIASILQNLAGSVLNDDVVCTLESHLAKNIENYILTNTNLALKQAVENLASCLDCFSLGTQSVGNLQAEVWMFVVTSLESLKKQLRTCPSPLETTELYSLCQQVLKVFSLYLQEYGSNIIILRTEKSLLSDTYSLIVWLLKDEFTVLNCRLSSGIALANLLKVDLQDKLFFTIKKIESGEYSRVPLSDFSYVSTLCFWGGLLASLSALEIVEWDEKGCSMLVDYIFPKICAGTESKEDSGIFLAQCRMLYLWTEKACQVLELSKRDSCEVGSEKIVHSLLQFVWAVWEHSADGVRYHGRGIFKNALRIHLLSNADDGENFLSSMTLHLLDLPWHCKGKYGALSHLVESVGCTKLLGLRPSIVSDLIEALLEGSLAPHVSELMESLSIKHKTECSPEVWQDTWLKPLVVAISEGTKIQRNGILQYVLPKLLKISPKSVHYITKVLVPSDCRTNDTSLCAMIMCIKAARACRIKFEKSQMIDRKEMWKDCLPFGMLRLALFHSDEQVRLDGLGLICDSPKTSEEISLKELDLLRSFIQFNTNIQSPSFRQKALSHLKKVMLRMRDSSHLILKKKDQSRSSHDEDVLNNYRSFLRWLIDFLFSSLHPEANFPRRGTVLHLLALLKEIFGFSYTQITENVTDSALGSSLEITPHHCQTLLKFTRDTYENNKELVLALLSDVPISHLHLENIKKYQELLDVSLHLASSSRPPDSVTAAYLFCLLVKQNTICRDAFTALHKDESLCNLKMPSDITSQSYFCVLSVLLRRLQKELAVAYESLLDAAANGPMYGVLVAIRMLLNDAQLNTSMSKEDEEIWSALLEKIVKISLHVTATVQPVVCNASPEGHLPMDADMSSVSMLQEAIKKAIGRRFDLAVVLEEKDLTHSDEERLEVDLVKTRAVTAQMLLLCSWRAHKEVSLLLGDICENIVLSRPEYTQLLSSKQIIQMGDFFIQQLSEIKHRGAFEQAYVGFCKLCKGLWRSTDSILHQLPQQWLKDLLASITIVDSEDVTCCPTRRSAGVPFIVQALLVTEPDVMNSRCFKEAMDALLKFSLPDDDYTKTQVHALNILRALYKDAHLGEEVTPYVAQGLHAAILGFKSEMWSVRNSATLLFTTLMTRIFGVNRSREDPHKKNCLTGRVFFLRYPAVFDFLLSELQSAVKGIEMSQQMGSDSLHSNLYPILLLLSRLYPSPIEGSDSLLQLGAFIPLVDSCSCSAIWWTRQLAARALVPLLPAETQPQYLESLFRRLSCCVKGILPQNAIHGRLLQILNVMRDASKFTKNSIKNDFYSWLDSCKYLLTSENPCAITRSAFLDIIACAVSFEFELSDGLKQLLLDQLILINNSTHMSIVFEEQYKLVMARTGLQVALGLTDTCNSFSLELALVGLLRSELYEVRSLCLDFLSWLVGIDGDDDLNGRSLDSVPLGRRQDWRVFSQERKIRLCNRVLNSDTLLQQLILMSETEKHAWCRAEAYYVLGSFQHACVKDWKLSNGLILDNPKKMIKVIEELEKIEFEDVAIAGLHFSGRLALAIYQEGQERGQLKSEHQILLGRWMLCVLSAASAASSVQKRSATAKVLLSAELLMTDESGILSPLNLPLWDATVILLQDDEPLIREIICRGGLFLQKHIFGDASEIVMRQPVISSLYLKTLISRFSSHFIQSYPEHCMMMLADWGLRCDSDISPIQSDEQPFNKGEMNVFAEEITLTDFAMERLESCLCADPVSNLSKAHLVKLDWSCNSLLEEFANSQNLAELGQRCFEKSRLLAQELIGCGHREVFLTHRVDSLALKLYQRVRLFETVFRHDRSIAVDISEIQNLADDLRKWSYLDSFTRGISDRLQSLFCITRQL